MWKALGLIKEGLRWRVGNGKNIRIWRQKWLSSLVSYYVQSPVWMIDGDAKVEELIQQNRGEWNEELVTNIFNEDEAEQILSIPLVKRIQKIKWCGGLPRRVFFL